MLARTTCIAFVPAVALALALVLIVVACVGDDPGSGSSGGNAGTDAGDANGGEIDAPGTAEAGVDAALCSPTGIFGPPEEVPGLHVTGAAEYAVRFSEDGLSALITRGPAATSKIELYLADRPFVDMPFGIGTVLPDTVNNAVEGAGRATFADEKKTIYFEARTPGLSYDIYSATRDDAASISFKPRSQVPKMNDPDTDEGQPYFVNDGLYFMFAKGPETDIRYAKRSASGFITPVVLTNLTTYAYPVVTKDERTIFVHKYKHLYEARRAEPGVAFGVPVELPPTVSTGFEESSDVSADGCILYFSRQNPTTKERQLFKTTRSK